LRLRPTVNSQQSTENNKSSRNIKQIYTPRDFSLFKEIFQFRLEYIATLTAIPCGGSLDLALRNLCEGYFEFSRPDKTAFYRKARNHIAELWLELELKSSEKIEAGFYTQIKNAQIRLARDILPCFSGVLRKRE
jgi:hypothetical protein